MTAHELIIPTELVSPSAGVRVAANVCVCVCVKRHLEGGTADLVEHGVVAHFGEVGALDLGGDADERFSEGIFGRGEDHLGLDLGIIRRPREEADLVSLARIALFVFKVVDGVSTFGGGELGEEVVVRGRGRGVLNDDFGVLVVETEDDVLQLFAELELLELVQALLGDFDTGGLMTSVANGVDDAIGCGCRRQHRVCGSNRTIDRSKVNRSGARQGIIG